MKKILYTVTALAVFCMIALVAPPIALASGMTQEAVASIDYNNQNFEIDVAGAFLPVAQIVIVEQRSPSGLVDLQNASQPVRLAALKGGVSFGACIELR